MKLEQNTKYPYARPSALEEFFNLIREEKNWKPSVINTSTFKTLGIASSKEGESIRTLKFLGVLDNDGKPTDIFDKLHENFEQTLNAQVKSSFKLVFDQIPLTRINQKTLVNFFMNDGYTEDTAEYQGSLFIYLCKIANIQLPNASTTFKRARYKNKKTKVSPNPTFPP